MEAYIGSALHGVSAQHQGGSCRFFPPSALPLASPPPSARRPRGQSGAPLKKHCASVDGASWLCAGVGSMPSVSLCKHLILDNRVASSRVSLETTETENRCAIVLDDQPHHVSKGDPYDGADRHAVLHAQSPPRQQSSQGWKQLRGGRVSRCILYYLVFLGSGP